MKTVTQSAKFQKTVEVVADGGQLYRWAVNLSPVRRLVSTMAWTVAAEAVQAAVNVAECYGATLALPKLAGGSDLAVASAAVARFNWALVWDDGRNAAGAESLPGDRNEGRGRQIIAQVRFASTKAERSAAFDAAIRYDPTLYIDLSRLYPLHRLAS